MAGRLSLPEADLSCPICSDIFKEPVVLKCSHSFCAPCLQQYWGRGRSRDCPLCRSQSVGDPVPSLTLRNLCESYIQESEGQEEKEGELYCDPGEMCPLHGERLKLFCLQDNEPICVVCHTSRRHKQHDCCPVSEAVVDVKGKTESRGHLYDDNNSPHTTSASPPTTYMHSSGKLTSHHANCREAFTAVNPAETIC